MTCRRGQRGKKKGETVAPATLNKDLRHLKAALNVALEWGYVRQLPRFRFEKESRGLPTYVSPEHFTAIYAACDHAKHPVGLPYPPADWWRSLLIFAYMTGWRIGQVLALRREDLDLEKGEVITRAADNNGKRDMKVKLHPVVIEHLGRVRSFEPCVFAWYHDRTTLQNDFGDLQRAAGIILPCRDEHEHTPACYVYGFHDLRRAFATMNADKLTPDTLQALMQHRSYLTTQVYINMARQFDDAVKVLHVPVLPQLTAQGG